MSKKRKQRQSNLPVRASGLPQTTSPKNVQQVSSQQAKIVQQDIAKFFSGPIPDPDSLEKYGQIDPELPNRIIAMAEERQKHLFELEVSQGDHRRKIELLAVSGDQKRAQIGQYSAIAITGLLTAGGVIVAVFKSTTVGSALIGAVLTSNILFHYVGGRDQKQSTNEGAN